MRRQDRDLVLRATQQDLLMRMHGRELFQRLKNRRVIRNNRLAFGCNRLIQHGVCQVNGQQRAPKFPRWITKQKARVVPRCRKPPRRDSLHGQYKFPNH